VRNMLDDRSFIETETLQLPVFADRPEPPRVESKWLDKNAVLKRQRWTPAELEAAVSLPDPIKFPVGAKVIKPGEWGYESRWKDTEIDRWAARVGEHVDLLRHLIRQK
jgi:hypothetical protein